VNSQVHILQQVWRHQKE